MPRLLIATLLWSLPFSLIPRFLLGVDADVLAVTRLGLGALALTLLVGGRVSRPKTVWLLVGAIQFGVCYGAYLRAYQFLPGHAIALLTTTTPIWILILNGQRKLWRGRSLLAVLLSVMGAIFLARSAINPDPNWWRGAFWTQLANLAFAFGQLRWRAKGGGEQSLGTHAWMLFAGALVLLPLAVADFPGGLDQISLEATGVLLYLGIGATGLGFYLWNEGARQVSVARLAVMNNLKAPLAALVAVLVFGEQAAPLPLTFSVLCLVAGVQLSATETRPD
jgi:drug/metabolite transporter (DMT)-like permease